MSLQVANTILAQLGGNKFLAMTGAKNLVGGDDTLRFKIPASNGINHVSITLDCNDTYRVTFGNFRKLELRIVHTVGNVYADQLRELFTNQTGLETSL
jgi:hypothetical protein